jgi:hypothetical protein
MTNVESRFSYNYVDVTDKSLDYDTCPQKFEIGDVLLVFKW